MIDAERLQWIDRMEIEAFGQRRPDEADYHAAFETLHPRSLAWFFGGLPFSALVGVVLQDFAVFLTLFCTLYVGGALLAYLVSKNSLTWRWYFVGHASLGRLSAIPPLSTWKSLRLASAESNDTAIRIFASRTWTDYQSALKALGRPVPQSASLKRGFGEIARWLPF